MADEGKLQKMEVDYSTTVDEKIPQCDQLAKLGNVAEAVETLLGLEKLTRTAADMHSTAKLLVAVVRLCYEAKDYTALNENIILLTKRRGQLKQAVTKMIQEAFTYVGQIQDMDTKLKLIDTLISVTAGKIYVEIERARLTRILASIREEQGNIKEAANVLQELQVETFGSMEKKEKVEFILEQMRLCLAKKDYIRTSIISKKINTRFFTTSSDVDELKLKYYRQMIELNEQEGQYLEMCKHFRAIYQTKIVQDNDADKKMALKCVVLCIILAPYDNEQADLIHRIKEEKSLEDIPLYRDLLKLFTTTELMRWQHLCTTYETLLRSGLKDDPCTPMFIPGTTLGDGRWTDLKHRVVEHNIRVMAKYYTRVTIVRMAELLDLTSDETEEFLSKLVVKKTVSAKINRLSGIIQFASSKNPNDILDDWSRNIQELMNLVKKSTHLITKEEMVNKLQR
ncbi:26S proteasome non-ATPase regulatory subunit 12-like [Watersipora subatra]|uniref:26S proteasome non-ATPase regulatory subunit 12-like n=1 Tax=Watersipora subatra TaxID=2589382 RepID=UPI00355C2AA0